MAPRFPVTLCDTKTKQLALLVGVLCLTSSEMGAAELVVQSASARPGETVEIAILLNPQETSVAAVVFEIDYDVTKLQFKPTSSSETASVLAIELDGFAVETFDDRAAAGRVGIAVYDPIAPVVALPAGVIATLRFQVRQSAGGYAAVTIAGRPPDAADPDGKSVPITANSAPTGVAISGGRARAVRVD